MAKLNKADILKGKDNIHSQYFDKLEGELELRPLTEGEWIKVSSMSTEGSQISGKPVFKNGKMDAKATQEALEVKIDVKQTQMLDFEAKALAVALSLTHSGEEWTADEIKELSPVGVVEDIAAIVFKISGVNEEGNQFAKSFRNK